MTIERNTVFSDCQKYRYTLWRVSPSGLFEMSLGNWTPYVNFVLLNPSTADETNDDPTIRRCVGFAKEWGYGAVCITNLFAFRATDPSVMKGQLTPVGPEGDEWIIKCAREADVVVAAWGTHGAYNDRDNEVLGILKGVKLSCLGVTKDGHPRHPLYLPKGLKPKPFKEAL